MLPLLAICGFLIGLGIVHFAHAENQSGFTATAQFKVWSSLAGAVVAIAFVVFVYSASILQVLRSRFPQDASWGRLLSFYAVFAVVIFSAMIIFGNPNTSSVADYAIPRTFFYVLALVAAGPSVMGIWLIDWALARMRDQISEAQLKQRSKQVLSDLMLARTKLLALLSAVGALIAVTVLALGALRNAVLAAKAPSGEVVEYPIEYVLLAGLFFSAITAVIYIPAYFRLQDRSRDYIETVFPVPDQGFYGSDKYANRENLVQLLRIDASLQETLQTGLAIVAPLIATLLSVLLSVPK